MPETERESAVDVGEAVVGRVRVARPVPVEVGVLIVVGALWVVGLVAEEMVEVGLDEEVLVGLGVDWVLVVFVVLDEEVVVV